MELEFLVMAPLLLHKNPSHTYPGSGTYTVTVTVTNATGCTSSSSQVIEIFDNIFIPNVISPNGDGVNDLFTIKANGMTTYDLVIMNRWGEKVFLVYKSPKNHWDGTNNGNRVPNGVLLLYIKYIKRKTNNLSFTET